MIRWTIGFLVELDFILGWFIKALLWTIVSLLGFAVGLVAIVTVAPFLLVLRWLEREDDGSEST